MPFYKPSVYYVDQRAQAPLVQQLPQPVTIELPNQGAGRVLITAKGPQQQQSLQGGNQYRLQQEQQFAFHQRELAEQQALLEAQQQQFLREQQQAQLEREYAQQQQQAQLEQFRQQENQGRLFAEQQYNLQQQQQQQSFGGRPLYSQQAPIPQSGGYVASEYVSPGAIGSSLNPGQTARLRRFESEADVRTAIGSLSQTGLNQQQYLPQSYLQPQSAFPAGRSPAKGLRPAERVPSSYADAGLAKSGRAGLESNLQAPARAQGSVYYSVPNDLQYARTPLQQAYENAPVLNRSRLPLSAEAARSLENVRTAIEQAGGGQQLYHGVPVQGNAFLLPSQLAQQKESEYHLGELRI